MSADKPVNDVMPGGKPDAGFPLEEQQRLSRSILWEQQRRFFAAQGIDAWRKSIVPHYISSNTFIARSYSRVVSGFLRDCLAGGMITNPSQPIYIVELGAGSGRFACHFLNAFQDSAERFRQEGLRARYVMTDFASRTLDYWKTHPFLKSFVERGRLAFARFDAGQDSTIEIHGCRETLAPDTLKNPLVVLANYFFDSIPQDLFSIRNGELHEQVISVFAQNGVVDPDEPGLLDRIQIAFEGRPIRDDYYGERELDELLQDYRCRLEDTFLLFPCAAIRCIRDLNRLCGGRMLLLAADQGYSSEEELAMQKEPVFNRHGSISMMVNYDALGKFVARRGGQVSHPAHRPASLNVSCFLLGFPANATPETLRAYEDAIARFGPDDFFTLKKGIEKMYETLSLPQILAYLRFSGGDAHLFLGVLPALLRLVDSCSAEEREDMRRVLRQVWENYYPIGEELDLAFQIGVLLYRAGLYCDALEFFRQSQRVYGPHACTSYDMGMCHYMLGDRESAQACVNEARRLDPDCEEAPWNISGEQASHG